MVAPPPKMAPTLWIHQKNTKWFEERIMSHIWATRFFWMLRGYFWEVWEVVGVSRKSCWIPSPWLFPWTKDDLRLPHDLLETCSRNWWNLGPFRNCHFCGPSYEAAITKGDTMRYPSDGIRIGIMVNDGEICGKLPTEYVRSHTHLAYWLSQPFLIPIILQATSPQKKHHMESLTLW